MNREQFLAARGRRVEKVKVAGLGDVLIAVMNARAALKLEGDMVAVGKDNLPDLVAVQVAAFVVDEKGNPILSVDDAKKAIDNLSAAQVKAIVKAGVRLNGLGGSEEDLKAVGGN